MSPDSVSRSEPGAPSRAVLITATVIAVIGTGAVVAIAATRTPERTPVPIAAVPAPHADDPLCAALLGAAPDRLGDYRRAEALTPVPPGAAAWREDAGGEPVILRCGLSRPAEFVVGSPLQVVDAVEWLRVADPADETRTTWFAVDRGVYVALTLPAGSGPAPIQDISDVIARVMPARPIDPAPAR